MNPWITHLLAAVTGFMLSSFLAYRSFEKHHKRLMQGMGEIFEKYKQGKL